MKDNKVYLTPEGRRKLEEELEYLVTVRRPEVARAIHDAKMDGDVAENAGYEEAKRQQGFLEGRIMTVEAMLELAVMIKAQESDVVMLGSQVTVEEDGWEPETYVIVGSAEAAPSAGRISNESPMGSALMGHRVGDRVTFESPGGVVAVTITAIE